MLRELIEIFAKSLSIILENSWRMGRGLKTGGYPMSLKNIKKKYPGNYRPVSLTSILVKLMEQLIYQMSSPSK